MGDKKQTYIAGQTIQNRVEIDSEGRQHVTQKVIYEQRELVDGYTDVRLPKRHRYNNGGFITLFQTALLTIVESGNLSKLEMTMLLWLLATAGVDGSVETNLDIISEALGQKKPNVSKALKGLVQRNIVLRKDGNRYDRTPLPMELSLNYDQINYRFAYNGKTANFSEKKISHPEIELQCGECEWVGIDTGEVEVDQKQLSNSNDKTEGR